MDVPSAPRWMRNLAAAESMIREASDMDEGSSRPPGTSVFRTPPRSPFLTGRRGTGHPKAAWVSYTDGRQIASGPHMATVTREQLHAYLDDALDDAETARIEKLIRGSAAVRTQLTQVRD